MRRLHLSYRDLLVDIDRLQPLIVEPPNDLYFLDKPRADIMRMMPAPGRGDLSPHDELRYLFTGKDGRHDRVRAAWAHQYARGRLLAAEAEGRIQWIGEKGDGSDLVRRWQDLNALLGRFDYPAVPLPPESFASGFSVGSNRRVRDAVQRHCNALMVGD